MKKQPILLTAALTIGLLGAVPVQTYAEDTAEQFRYLTAAKQITVTEDGIAFCMDGDQKRKGRFALSPDFCMGDLNHDETVNSVDAVCILMAAAKAGTAGMDAATALTSMYPEDMPTKEKAQAFADVNEDGVINAKDATLILMYSAKVGTGTVQKPLGTHEYWADSEGNLRKGFITDETTGKRYYADENYQLAENSFELDGKVYYVDTDGSVTEKDVTPPDEPPSAHSGFQTIDGKLYYYDDNGTLVKGWFDVENEKYCSDDDGEIRTGQQVIDGKIYYFSLEDGRMQTGWVETDGNYRYYNESGVLQAGWLTLDTGTYFLQTTGNLLGARVTGLRKIGDALYLFDNETGVMLTGSVQNTLMQGYFNEQGKLTGWLNYGEYRFYAQPDGTIVSGQVQIGNEWYCFNENGMMQTGFVETDKGVLYFNEDGTRYSGWLRVGENYQYFNPDDGLRATGFRILTLQDGKEVGRFFDQNGNRCKGGFFTDPTTKKTYYIDENGTAVKGFAIIPYGSNNFYYFDVVDYHMATGWYYMQTVDVENNRIKRGNLYYYDENGKQVVNQTVGNWKIDASGTPISMEKSTTLPRIRDRIFTQNGIVPANSTDDAAAFNALYNYIRSNGALTATRPSMTPEQLEEKLFDLENPLRWTYFAANALQGNAPSSEYIAAGFDYLLREAGFTSVVMFAKNSTGYHYWNAVKVDGKMLNYDVVNGWTAMTDDEITAMGGYDEDTLDYYDSLNDMIYN